jgi:transketolase
VIGFGAPNKQGGHDVHGAPLGDAEIAAARDQLNWTFEPFEIPQDVYHAWRRVAARGHLARAEWETRLAASPLRAAFLSAEAGDAKALPAAIARHKAALIANLTRPRGMNAVQRNDYAGNYLHFGIREHGMAAALNGLALHGGFRPYGGTFLAFADYCRPAIRLSALMGAPVTYVMTHDSIGLGEDGPTHQPVEHLASLRAIPNLWVIRPADAVETAEAWEIAMKSTEKPVMLVLSRQNLPTVRREQQLENLTARGAYVLREVKDRQVTLIATGSEVALALQAADRLAAEGIRAAVVSAPCFEAFAAQPRPYVDAVLGDAPRIGIEAALRQGWDLFLGPRDGFVGMTGFGASAPAPQLYQNFNITVEAIASEAKSLI